jgi:hypothetical protein
MKKIIYLSFISILGINLAHAKPVIPASAKTVAENFYKLNAQTPVNSVVLAYTEVSATSGLPLFYAFNINNGYVIVTAEDAANPIIGYSTSNTFVVPEAYTTIGHWLKNRGKEIDALRANNMVADAKTAAEWTKYTSNTLSALKLNNNASTLSTTTVTPLVQTTWNQSPYYNQLCPGGSVTGCVATAMAQIMRYWNYPAKGTGSTSYKQNPNPNNYPAQSANYGATTYNWANMPLSIGSNNSDVATLNYQCGVSVDMNYDPSGSGAEVITADDPICAQHSYITYFGYDPTKIKGLRRSSYPVDSVWIKLLQSDLNIGRPIQYVGDDPSEGGHTWVCDGYDVNNYFHMNWGWGGQDNGFFAINNLATPGFNPSEDHEALMGIVPKYTNVTDAGIPSITSPSGFYCTTGFTPIIIVQNFGTGTLTSCVINYRIDNGTLQTQNWSGTMVSGQAVNINLPAFTASAGTHTLVCYSSNPDSTVDQNTANDQSTVIFNVTLGGGILPVAEGFENTTLPSSTWMISHTAATGSDWAITTNGAATGVKSCMIDNMNNTAGNNSILETFSSYDLSTLSSPALSFKVAYQAKATTDNNKLQVYVSTDCGAGWTSRWARIGTALATVSGGVSPAFTPAATDFTTYTVNIVDVATSKGVLFRWEFYADPAGAGNNLYIDDINIFDAVATGIKNIETAVNLNLYPNPSAGQVNIDFTLAEKHSIAVNVSDMLGRTVETIDAKTYQAGESTLTIGSKTPYQAGIYLVNIDIDGQRIAKKIVIQ